MSSSFLEGSRALNTFLKEWSWRVDLLLILIYEKSVRAVQEAANALPNHMRPLLNIINLMRAAKAELLKNPALFWEVLSHIREQGGYSYAQKMREYYFTCLMNGREETPFWATIHMDSRSRISALRRDGGRNRTTSFFHTRLEGLLVCLTLFVSDDGDIAVSTSFDNSILNEPIVVFARKLPGVWPYAYHGFNCWGTTAIIPGNVYEETNGLVGSVWVDLPSVTLSEDWHGRVISDRFLERLATAMNAQRIPIKKIAPSFDGEPLGV